MTGHSTSAYADAPKSGRGPGVLVLHSWWGQTEAVKDRCNQLADAGFTALAPDLFGGQLATDAEHGKQLLMEADVNELVLGIQSCADALRQMPATPDGPIMVVGFSMGGSLGLWLSEREAETVSAVVSFYATQSIDFVETQSRYQFHLVADDPMVDHDELVLMQASIGLAGRAIDVHEYPGVTHNFAEPEADAYDPAAAELAWSRTIDFLRQAT